MQSFLKYYNNAFSIIILAFLGGIIGLFFRENIYFLKPFGDIFINLIKMLLVPVIFFTVIHSTSSLSNHRNAFSLGVFTFSYFFITSFFAGILGIVLSYYFTPGIGVIDLPKEFLTLPTDLKEVAENTRMVGFWDFVSGMIPKNPIKALTEGNLLSILFFAIFVGIAISYSKHKDKEILVKTVASTSEMLMWMVRKVMLLAPVAVFCLMAYLVGSIGTEVVYLVGKFFVVVILGYIIWIYVIIGSLVTLFSRVSYVSFFKNTLPLKLFAFSTSSSIVSLPKNLEACDKMSIDQEISRFVLPVAATLNMNGSSLFYAVVTVFFAQMFEVPLDLYTYILIALTAALGSMATPGVPGLSLTVVMVLMVANVPLIGLPLIIAVDRILDMFTTTTNVIGDTSCATIADRFFAKKSSK